MPAIRGAVREARWLAPPQSGQACGSRNSDIGRIKAKPHLAGVPVIFMTGLSETEHIVRGLDAGGVDYVTKPIVPDELLARIRTHLARARSARGARTALDAMGRILLAVSANGRVLWCTPQAGQVIAALAPTREGVVSLPPEAVAWLRTCLAGTAARSAGIGVR